MNLFRKKAKESSPDVSLFLESFPENCRFAFEQAVKIFSAENPKIEQEKFAFFGMGGSGIVGSIVKDLFPDRDIHVFKDHDLPAYVGKDFFCVAVSYSGNTEECISLLKEAKKRNLPHLSVFSGGKLSRMKGENSFSIKVPSGLLPRFSLDHMLFSVLGFFEAAGIEKIEKDAKEAFRVLENLKETLSSKEKNPALDIASSIREKIPVIYGFGPYGSAAFRAKTQFNENAKVPAFTEMMPEADHNGIMGWLSKKMNRHIAAIVIRDEAEETKEMKKRMEYTTGIMKKTAASVIEIRPVGKSNLAKIMSVIYMLDYVSYYAALLEGADPADTSVIEGLKKEIRKS